MALSAARTLCLLVVLQAWTALAAAWNECQEKTKLVDGAAVVVEGLCNNICSDFQNECPEYKCLCFYIARGSCVLNLERRSRFGHGFCHIDVVTNRESLEAVVSALHQENGDGNVATNIVWPWLFFPPSPAPSAPSPAPATAPIEQPAEPEPMLTPVSDFTPEPEESEPVPTPALESEWAPETAPMYPPESEWAPEPAPMYPPEPAPMPASVSAAVPNVPPLSAVEGTMEADITTPMLAAVECVKLNQALCIGLSMAEEDGEQSIYQSLDFLEDVFYS